MNPITEARLAVAEELSNVDGLKNVYDHMSNKINTPAAIVVPADPYLIADMTFGPTYKVNLKVLLITKYAANNSNVSESLDAMIVAAVEKLTEQHEVQDVAVPVAVNIDGNDYLATSFTVQINYKESID